jgi:hypothetical protein
MSGGQYYVLGHFNVNDYNLEPFSNISFTKPSFNYIRSPCYNMVTTEGGLKKPKSQKRHFKPFNIDPSLNMECTNLLEPALR